MRKRKAVCGDRSGTLWIFLAKRLAEQERSDVIDRKETNINDAVTFTDNAYMMTDLSKENLRNVGIQNCDTVIVASAATLPSAC